MRITSFHINGFGLFTDVTLESLSPGINLFYGDNESGKSTLLAFVRSVFFGFPDGRSRENIYPPLSSQRHGGRITVSDDEGNEIGIERFSDSRKPKIHKHYSNTSQEERSLTPSVLGKENRNLFKNVFAFSLAELQNFESLSRDSIQEALYSASVGIEPNALARLKSSLEKENDELFKPGGRNPTINKILNRLTALQNEKKALNSTVDEYDRIRSRLRELDLQIAIDEEKKVGLEKEARQLERWLNVWPEYLNLCQTKAKLTALEKVDDFPDRGISRFESLKEKIEETNRELREREEEYQKLESELIFLGPGNKILACEAEIKQIKRDQGRLDDISKDLIATERELRECKNRLETSMTNLGKDWTEQRICSFDLSLARREEIRRIRDQLGQEQIKKERSIEVLEGLRRKKDELAQKLAHVWVSEESEPEIVYQKKTNLKRLKNNLLEEHGLDRELGYLKERIHDLSEEMNRLKDMKVSGMGPWVTRIGYALFLLATPLLIFFGFHLDHKGILTVLIPLAILLIFIRWIKQRLNIEAEKQELDLEERFARATDKGQELDKKQGELLAEKEKMKSESVVLLDSLSLEKEPRLEELDKKIEETELEIEQLKKVSSLKGEIEDIATRIREAEHKRAELEQRNQEVITRWSGWLRQHNLDPALSPEGALETLSLIESCREQVERINRLRSILSSLRKARSQILEVVNRVISFLHLEPIQEENLLIAVHDLSQEFERAEKDQHQRDILSKDQKSCSMVIQRLEEHKKGLVDELMTLLDRAGVKQEEDFIRKAEVYERSQGLLLDCERYQDSLYRLTRGLEEPDRVIERMSVMSLDDLESRKVSVDKQLKTLGDRLESSREERAKAEERSEQLSQDDRAGVIRYEEQTLKEELAVTAEEWAINQLGLALIGLARARFERDRQPDVIREASRFFYKMTLGRYHSVIAPIGENSIEIIAKDDTTKELDQLSRGTAEQLYLSLRFGFIREFSKHSPSLPVIMDDILVNFDPHRAEATIRGLIELSQNHQILFFTCHPETIDLFKKTRVKAKFFHISRGNIDEASGD